MKLLIFSIIFALLNRIRGSELRIKFIRLDPVATIIIAGIISYLIYIPTQNLWALIGGILYIIGERPGWGKFMGTCIDDECRYNRHGGIVGWLANLIIPEKKDCVLYSQIGLAIRGFYWFAPMLIFSGMFIILPLWPLIIGIIVLSIFFPASVYLSKKFPVPILWPATPVTWTTEIWAKSELVYGFIQGSVIYFLLQ